MIARKLEVTYLPFDRTTRVPPGTTVFSAQAPNGTSAKPIVTTVKAKGCARPPKP